MWRPVTSRAGLYKESMDGIKELIKSFLGIVLVVAVSFLIGCRYGRKTARKPVDLRVVWDTTEVVRHDTIVREKPVYVASYIHDTVRTYFTTIEQDTVLVDVPIERKVYHEDSLYQFSFGAALGPSVLATPGGQVHAGLGATIGLQYRF